MTAKKHNNYPVQAENVPEFIGQLIDIFEDFLDEKGITIPSEDRDNEGLTPEESANIYGEDYDILRNEIEETLRNWNIIEKK